MDCIIFHIGDTTIQLSDGVAIFSTFDLETEREQQIEVQITRLTDALSTARMLVKTVTPNAKVVGPDACGQSRLSAGLCGTFGE